MSKVLNLLLATAKGHIVLHSSRLPGVPTISLAGSRFPNFGRLSAGSSLAARLVSYHARQACLRYPNSSLIHGRTLSSSPSASAQSRIFPDPSRSDLFFHLVNPPNPLSSTHPAYALSFLSTSVLLPDSKTVIGWVPVEASLSGFRENVGFREILHEAIQKGLEEGVDDIQINGAIQVRNGWMHVHDDRNIPALGRIGDPDDIIASVLVEDGKILAETYQPMPAYRLCTADGLTRLTPGLDQKLREVLTFYANQES